jgi:hypothetical protein
MTIGYLCRVNLNYTTGLPRDASVNDWVATFDSGVPSSADLDAFALAVSHYYTQNNDGVATIGSYMASCIDRGASKTTDEIFAIPDAPGALGAPVHTGVITIPAQNVSGVDLPNEIAICQSFSASTTGIPEHGAGGTRPKARRRGRIFLGPLITASMRFGHGAGTPQRPDTAFITKMNDSANAVHDELIAAGWHWAVWSRVDWACHSVITASVDDEFDVQRRRGEDPGHRTSVVL